jgi:tetratricopeptide (TPR) repeat protein
LTPHSILAMRTLLSVTHGVQARAFRLRSRHGWDTNGRRLFRMRRFLISLLCFAIPAGLLLAQQKEKAAPDYSKEAYLVEEMRTTYRFENDGTGRREFYLRARVNSEAGVQAFGQLVFGYNSVNERVEIPFVRVHKADGVTVVAPADSVQDLALAITQQAPVYTDYRQKHVTVPGLRPGEVLEYEMDAVIHTPLAPNQFWISHDFSTFGIILNEQLEVNIPAERKVALKTTPGNDAKISEEGGRRIYRWKSSHLERDEDEEKDPKKKKARRKNDPDPPAVQMTTFASWEELGRWYASLESERRQPSEEIRVKAAALTAGKATDLEKVEALYDFVAKNFRYVSLSFGTGRYQPHAAADVFHNQYGDCKDKHTLLASMLEASGMHASSVLINSSRKLDPDVPSPSQFDHVITLLPLGKEEVWMDTTAEIAPFRMLAYGLRKKQALVIPQGQAPRLEETPADPSRPSRLVVEVDGKVSESGKLQGTVHLTASGDNELIFRSIFRRVPSPQWNRVMESIDQSGGVNGEVQDLRPGDPADTQKPFEIFYKVTDNEFLDWTQKKLEKRIPFSSPDLAQIDPDDSSSSEPYRLGIPGEYVYRIRLEFPEKYTLQIPVSFAVKRDYAEYEAAYRLDGHVFSSERKLTSRLRELPVERGRDYASFYKTVSSDLAQSVTLESASAGADIPADLKPDDLNASGYQAIQSGDYRLAVDLLERATKADPKHKYAWNNLGLAYVSLGRYDDGIQALKKQIEVNPYDEYAYNNLGRAYRSLHQNENAEQAFKKQIEINPLDRFAHENLGALYVEWKKYADAVPELEKAASLAPDNPETQIQLGTAYLNLGQDERAQSAFEKAVKIAAVPVVWNNIAYELSQKSVRLDLARQYAESAVASTAASSRNFNLEHATRSDLAITYSLSSYWDTLGWVYFAQQDLDKAQKYVQSAWVLSGRGEVGKHLAQIYEKRGQKDLAIQTYAAAANTVHSDPESRSILTGLVGAAKVPDLLEKNRFILQDLRTLHLGKIAKSTGNADFLVLLGPEGAESAKFVSGDVKLKAFDEVLRKARYSASFPDDTPAKLLRRGTLSCSTATGNCDFVLLFPDDVRSVD